MLAVTTRNKLKSIFFFAPMLLARRQVRDQLRRTRGLIRWADATAGLSEFYTLTVWANKQAMFDFMSSAAHREMMWMFTRWSDEFWSMRWAASQNEVGAWNGLKLGAMSNRAYPRRAETPIPDISLPPRPGAGPLDPSRCPVVAVTAQVRVKSPNVFAGSRLERTWLRELKKIGQANLLRWAIGSIAPNEFLIVTLWDGEGAAFFDRAKAILRDGWMMTWNPGDYEIGHWDGLRLRSLSAASKWKPDLQHAVHSEV